MKITKQQLRRIIKEEREKLLHEEWQEKTAADAQDTRQLKAILMRDMNRGVATVEEGEAPDELYIMTGGAQGVTVKVVRSGR